MVQNRPRLLSKPKPVSAGDTFAVIGEVGFITDGDEKGAD